VKIEEQAFNQSDNERVGSVVAIASWLVMMLMTATPYWQWRGNVK